MVVWIKSNSIISCIALVFSFYKFCGENTLQEFVPFFMFLNIQKLHKILYLLCFYLNQVPFWSGLAKQVRE